MARRSTRLKMLSGITAAILAGLSPQFAHAATCAGACGVSAADGVVTAPPGGSTYGWVSTSGGQTGVGQIASLNGTGSERATNGSLFTTASFTVSAPQVISYNFNYITSDGQSPGGSYVYQDYAFAQLVDLTNPANSVYLFTARTAPGAAVVGGAGMPALGSGVVVTPSSTPWTAGAPSWSLLGASSGACYGLGCGATGWMQSNYTVSAPGLYQVVFGVSNWNDQSFDTGLAFSGAQVPTAPVVLTSGVPEPASWAMMLLGFGVAGAGLRFVRRRKRATAIAA